MRTVIPLALLVLALAIAPSPARSVHQTPPTLVGFEWLPRGDSEAGPVLRLALTVWSPHGVASGRVVAKSTLYRLVEETPLPAQLPGRHTVVVELRAPDMSLARAYAWELTDVELTAPDGEQVAYDLCQLVALGDDTRETGYRLFGAHRVYVGCLDAGGWALVTFRATAEGAWADAWGVGVYTQRGQSHGWGYVLRDDEDVTVKRNAVLSIIAGSRDGGDHVVVRSDGETLAEYGEPIEQPAFRSNYGFGSIPVSLEPGRTYTWALYQTFHGPIDQPLLLLHGEHIEVLDVQRGDSVAHYTGDDFGPTLSARSGSFDRTALVHGHRSVTAEHSITGYFRYLPGTAVTSVRGPDGTPRNRALFAAEPGRYDFDAWIGEGWTSWSDLILSVADLPIAPEPQPPLRPR